MQKPKRTSSGEKSTTMTLLVFLALASVLVFAACNEPQPAEEQPRPTPRPAPFVKSVRPQASTPENNWQRHCQRCHQRSELAGKTADDISAALRTIPSMRPFQGRLSDEELAGIAELLAPAQAEASDGAPPTAAGD